MSICAGSAGLLWTSNPAFLIQKGSFVQWNPFDQNLPVVHLIGGDKGVVRLTARSAGKFSLRSLAEIHKCGPEQVRKGGRVQTPFQTKGDSIARTLGAGLIGVLRLEPKKIRSSWRSENGGRLQAVAVGESNRAQRTAVVAQTNASSSGKTADFASTITISKRTLKSSSGVLENVPDSRSGEASVSDSEAKVCIQCQRAKLACDFQKIKSSTDKRADTCRACLAVVKARRLDEDMGHLSIGVDEAWERAKACTKYVDFPCSTSSLCLRLIVSQQASLRKRVLRPCSTCNDVCKVACDNGLHKLWNNMSMVDVFPGP